MVSTGFPSWDEMKYVDWSATALVNSARAFAAGLLWTPFLLAAGGAWSTLLAPVIAGIGYIMAAPMYFLAMKLFIGVMSAFGEERIARTATSLMTVIVGLAVSIGDPLVWIGLRVRPGILPIEGYRLMYFAMIVFVEKPAVQPVGTVL